MGILFTDDRGVYICYFPIFALLHLLNRHRNPVRNLLIQGMEGLFPDELRHNLAFWLVGYSIFVIKHRAIRQVFENQPCQFLRMLPAEGGKGDYLCKIILLLVGCNAWQDIFFFYGIRLVND